MYKLYAGEKNILKVEGDHNSERPGFMNDSVAIFFHNAFLVEHRLHFQNCSDEPEEFLSQKFKSPYMPPQPLEPLLKDINVLSPVQSATHISNEDYLFCLDRTLVKTHLSQMQISKPSLVEEIEEEVKQNLEVITPEGCRDEKVEEEELNKAIIESLDA